MIEMRWFVSTTLPQGVVAMPVSQTHAARLQFRVVATPETLEAPATWGDWQEIPMVVDQAPPPIERPGLLVPSRH